jgi:hypothetical protein
LPSALVAPTVAAAATAASESTASPNLRTFMRPPPSGDAGPYACSVRRFNGQPSAPAAAKPPPALLPHSVEPTPVV